MHSRTSATSSPSTDIHDTGNLATESFSLLVISCLLMFIVYLSRIYDDQ